MVIVIDRKPDLIWRPIEDDGTWGGECMSFPALHRAGESLTAGVDGPKSPRFPRNSSVDNSPRDSSCKENNDYDHYDN